MSEDGCPHIAVLDTLHLVVLGSGVRKWYCPGFDKTCSLMPIVILFISSFSNI